MCSAGLADVGLEGNGSEVDDKGISLLLNVLEAFGVRSAILKLLEVVLSFIESTI